MRAATAQDNVCARRAAVRGVVQGVGFRPFVATLARALNLAGSVSNDGAVVTIVIQGSATALDRFADRLPTEAPAAARIEAVDWGAIAVGDRIGFSIADSREGEQANLPAIGPDLRVCPTCLAELSRADDRRVDYPFVSCTGCGPRLTIAAASPWARSHSAMAGFEPCPDCRREYDDADDRRWHAEAIACRRCGPSLWLEDLLGRRIAEPEQAIAAAVALLRRGEILGLQGLGGFQLLVAADDPQAVQRLRDRKRRPDKPLALMVLDREQAAALVGLDALAIATLDSPTGPIVLLPRRPEAAIAEAVAPGQPRLGIMLATTPVHALLLRALGAPVVATSGNVHARPIAITIPDARTQLAGIADALLVHDRPILRRCDDAVVQLVAGEARTLRLGRGLAPARFELGPGAGAGATILALGGQLQAAPVLALGERAIAWPHVGDLDEPHTRAAMIGSLADLCALTRATPQVLACDAHPDYAGTIWARQQPGVRVEPVFHHHAHVAAVLAEHGRTQALGVAWDGVGLGEDHGAWGGEFLAVDPGGARRVAGLRPFPLPGGDAAARDGLRALAGLLAAAEIEVPGLPGIDDRELAQLLTVARRPRLSPPTSSVGRLFDAFACLLGIRRRSRYQAQAACELEHAAAAHGPAPAYPFVMDQSQLDWRPMLRACGETRGEHPGLVAARLHATLIAMIVAVVEQQRATTVALAGGCFANAILLAGTIAALRERGVEVLSPRRMPPGDGGLALGQAWVVHHRRTGAPRSCA